MNSTKPLSIDGGVVLFIDRSLGKHTIARHLKDARIPYVLHDDVLPPDAPDEQWIDLVGRNGWLAVTMDRNIRYRTLERNQVVDASAKLLVLRAKNVTGDEMGKLLVKFYRKISKWTSDKNPPLLARIDRNGKLDAYPL